MPTEPYEGGESDGDQPDVAEPHVGDVEVGADDGGPNAPDADDEAEVADVAAPPPAPPAPAAIDDADHIEGVKVQKKGTYMSYRSVYQARWTVKWPLSGRLGHGTCTKSRGVDKDTAKYPLDTAVVPQTLTPRTAHAVQSDDPSR